ANGTVWAWGDNGSGQLGIARTSSSAVPVQVRGLQDVTAIATGLGYHNLALDQAGTVWAWGANQLGQLGDGTTCPSIPCGSHTPVRVSLPDRATAIAAGRWHSLASTADGSVWAWGQDCDGGRGNGPVVQACAS